MTEYPKPYNASPRGVIASSENFTPVEAPSQTPPIEILVRVLEKEQAELIEAVGALEARLSGVLSQEVRENQQKDVSPSPGGSPLAQNLAGRVMDVSNLVRRISDIIKRLEV